MNVGEGNSSIGLISFRWRVRLGQCLIDTVTLTGRPEPVEELRVNGKLRRLWDATPGDYSFCVG